MSLTKAQFKETAKSIGAVLLATTFMAANANAADQAKFVQVADLDLNRPIPSNVCVKDDNQGTALDKMKTIMGARGQKSIVAANQVVQNVDPENGGLVEKMVTSTLKQGGEGYIVTSNKPLGKSGTGYCFAQNKEVYIYSVFNSAGVPNAVNKGELGISLANNDKAGLKVAIVAMTEQNTIKVLNFDPASGRGSIKGADGSGNKAGDMAYLNNVGYSASLPIAAKKALGIPEENLAQTNDAPVAYAAANPSPSR